MNTFNIEMISKYINSLKNWNGFKNLGGKIDGDALPTSIIFDSAKVNDEVTKAINNAAFEVLKKYIPIAEKTLLEIVAEESKKQQP